MTRTSYILREEISRFVQARSTSETSSQIPVKVNESLIDSHLLFPFRKREKWSFNWTSINASWYLPRAVLSIPIKAALVVVRTYVRVHVSATVILDASSLVSGSDGYRRSISDTWRWNDRDGVGPKHKPVLYTSFATD